MSVVDSLVVGTVVSITSARLSLSNVTATVDKVRILGVRRSFSCVGADGQKYAFFGDETEQCVTIVSQPSA